MGHAAHALQHTTAFANSFERHRPEHSVLYQKVPARQGVQAFVSELSRSYQSRAKRHLGLRSVSLAHIQCRDLRAEI
jgi:hypothetical protein